jgi:hypothetical protein
MPSAIDFFQRALAIDEKIGSLEGQASDRSMGLPDSHKNIQFALRALEDARSISG